MSVDSIAFAEEVGALSPDLAALLDDHRRDNFGELLPHVFIGDVTRHAVALTRSSSTETRHAVQRAVRAILDKMEAGYATGVPEVQELIAASFLENLPTKREPGREIRGMLGPRLASQLEKMA